MTQHQRHGFRYAIVLRGARNVLGLTQKELEAESHVSQPTIARIELGDTKPQSATWSKLVNTLFRLGVRINEWNGFVTLEFDADELSIREAQRVRKQEHH